MTHYQHLLFTWITAQSAATGLVVMAAGLLAAAHGFRMIRFLLALCGAGVGYAAGVGIAPLAQVPALAAGAILGTVCAAAGAAWPRAVAVVINAATWAIGGAYLAEQFGARGIAWWLPTALLGAAGATLMLVSPRSITILMTSLQGSAVFIVGFAGVADAVLPVLGSTFRSWAQHRSLILPVLVGMLAVTAYSYQANARRGDLRTAGSEGPRGAARRRRARANSS